MKFKREYSIALLVMAGVGLLIFGINFLKGLDLFQKRNVYHAVYNNVSGIAGASPVYFNGLKVGLVVGVRNQQSIAEMLQGGVISLDDLRGVCSGIQGLHGAIYFVMQIR